MEANMRWVLLAAVAPVAWGANYYVTKAALPPGDPLYGGAIRAVPAGLLLLALRRNLPRGAWWWRSALLGVLNAGGFFALVYLAAQRLPTSTAATVMAASPLVMALIAWSLIAERPRAAHLLGAAVGIGGVCLMLWGGSAGADPLGVAASVGAMLLSSLGYVLAKRWGAGVDVLASTCWQLLAGGLLLLPFAAVFEGAPPALGARALLGFGYVAVIATAVAFTAWFAALRHLPAATVGLVGLLNPVTGVLLGTAVAHEPLTARQLAGLPLVLAGVLLGRPGKTPTRRPCRAVSPPGVPELCGGGCAEPVARLWIFARTRRPRRAVPPPGVPEPYEGGCVESVARSWIFAPIRRPRRAVSSPAVPDSCGGGPAEPVARSRFFARIRRPRRAVSSPGVPDSCGGGCVESVARLWIFAPIRRPRRAVPPPGVPEQYEGGPAEPVARPWIFAPVRRPSAPTAVGPVPRTAPGPLAGRRPWRRRPPS